MNELSCAPFQPSERGNIKQQVIEILERNGLNDSDIGEVVRLLYETYQLGCSANSKGSDYMQDVRKAKFKNRPKPSERKINWE